jgi:hypothetical protein
MILLVISRCFDLLSEQVRGPISFGSIFAIIVRPSSSMAVGTSWSTASTSTLSMLLHVILVTSLLMLLSCQAGRLRPW